MPAPKFTAAVNFANQALPITLTGTGANPAGTARWIGGAGYSQHLQYNVPAGGNHTFTVAGSPNDQFSYSTSQFLIWFGGQYRFYVTSAGASIGGSSPPARMLEVVATSAAQLRLTYTAASVYTEFLCDSSNNFTLTSLGKIQFNAPAASGIAFWSGGSGILEWHYRSAASGEKPACGEFAGQNDVSIALIPCISNASTKTVGIYYHNQTQYYKAVEVANVASGFGTLSLMTAGGIIRLGAAAGTGNGVVVGGGVSAGASYCMTVNGATQFGNTNYFGTDMRVGGQKIILTSTAASGEMLDGGFITPYGGNGVALCTYAGNGVNSYVQMVYHNGTAYYAAAEIRNVSSGFGDLKLMKGGGFVTLGGGAGLRFTNATKLTPSGTVPILYGDTEAHLWLPTGSNFYVRTATSGSAVFYVSDTNAAIGLGISGGRLGFYGATPVVRPAAYTVTNPASRRSFDTTTVTLSQLAEVVGTIIADKIANGSFQ